MAIDHDRFLRQLEWNEPEGERWISGLLKATQLLDRVRATLQEPVETHHVEIRLAATVIWIIGLSDTTELTRPDIELAIARLRDILQLDLYALTNPEVATLVEIHIESLELLFSGYPE